MDEVETCREQPLADVGIGWSWHGPNNRRPVSYYSSPRREPVQGTTLRPSVTGAFHRNRTSGRAGIFQDDGNALPGTDAHAGRAVADVPLPQFGCQRQDVAGAGGAEGVSDGHRATVGVELVIGNVEAAELVGQFAKHAERLCAERLMHLPHVDLLRGQPGPLDRRP